MSGVLVAVGTAFQVVGGMINMYRSSPPVSVYRGSVTRGFLERWVNNAQAFRAKQPAFYPYVNDIDQRVEPTQRDAERLSYWLQDYNRKIIDEWGDDSGLDVDSYLSLRSHPYVYDFLLQNEVHMNKNHLYVVSNADKYIITPEELFQISSISLNQNDFNSKVVDKIRYNHSNLSDFNTDNGNSSINPNNSDAFSSGFFDSKFLFLGIFGIVLYFLIKR